MPSSVSLPETLSVVSVTVSVALREPSAPGMNSTFTVQVPDGAIVSPLHRSEFVEKSPAFVPLIVTPAGLELINRLAVPVFVTVT